MFDEKLIAGRCAAVMVAAVLGCLFVGVGSAGAVEPPPVFGIESFSNTFADPPFSEEGIETLRPALSEPFLDRGGVPYTQAGGHPFAMTITMVFAHTVLTSELLDPAGSPEEEVPSEILMSSSPKGVTTSIPPGVVLDPQATPTKCKETELEAQAACPRSSAVGVLAAYVKGFPYRVPTPLFNMVAPVGAPAQFGANLGGLGFVVHLNGRVRAIGGQQGGYVLSGEAKGISNAHPVYGIVASFWSDPSASSHDAMRGECAASPPYAKAEGERASCPLDPSETSETAFVRMPSSCTGEPLVSSVSVESWDAPSTPYTAQFGAEPVNGCEALQFKPSIQARPETTAANSPTGLKFTMQIPQENKVGALASADLKDAVVTLPEGVQLNPAAANGLAACPLLKGTEGSHGEPGINLENNKPANCPNASQVGKLTLKTPLLAEPLTGAIYLAAQNANPFSSLLAIYLAIYDKERGVVVKLAGHVQPDPTTGRLRTTFTNNPQIPFATLELEFYEGAGAALRTPASCGTATTTSQLTPWSAGAPATPTASFDIDQGCEHPFNPSFTAGTIQSQAGAYSPFTLSFSRTDSEQEFKGLEQTLPPGLLAKLAGVPLCPDTLASTGNCPQSSRIGSVTAVSGTGPNPISVQGEIYLTGPYNHGPFGETVQIPAIAGPFNLGTVTVRGSIRIDPTTTQATVLSDPFPQYVNNTGIPSDIRRVDVTLDRPNFTFTPTNCTPLATTATLTSTQNTTAHLSSPYQASHCPALPFTPKLTASTGAHATKLAGTNFTVKLQSPGIGQANIHKVELQLPKALPSRLTTLQKACLATTFAANPATCSPESIIGHATIHTPTLTNPLTGPAYLVSHGGTAFPDVEFVLQGENITLILDGKTDIKNGITYSRFETTPDAPFTTFETELPAGPHSILTANTPKTPYNLCNTNLKMPTKITAQNNATTNTTTTITTPHCPPTILKTTHKHNTLHITLQLHEPGTLHITSPNLKPTTTKQLTTGTHTITLHTTHNPKHHHTTKIHITQTTPNHTTLTTTTTTN